MIVVHGETLWLPAPQPMDDDDVYSMNIGQIVINSPFYLGTRTVGPWALESGQNKIKQKLKRRKKRKSGKNIAQCNMAIQFQ